VSFGLRDLAAERNAEHACTQQQGFWFPVSWSEKQQARDATQRPSRPYQR